MSYNIKVYGFTLAEVLITLVIIGVIAAITVPSLINKTNNQEYVSRLKKAYSVLGQTTNLIIANEGSPKNGWADSSEHIYQLYKKYLNNAKECSYNSEEHTPSCFNQLLNGKGYTYLNGNGMWRPSSTTYTLHSLVLSDGMQIMFESDYYTSLECNLSNDEADDICARIVVDVNGARKPNIYGRDLFKFYLRKGGVTPYGCKVENESDLCNKNNSGWSCACRVLREGAMNY